MQANFSDSSLFPEQKQKINYITSTDGFNDSLNPNNLNFLSSSSFEQDSKNITTNSTSYTNNEPITANLNNSNLTVYNGDIQLNANTQDNSSIQNTADFNETNGYGLVDASEAVAKVTGEDTFDDVPNTGGKNWGADAVNAPEVWEQGYTGEGVVVAVLDTGVDYNHDDLKNNIWTNNGEIANNGIDDDDNGYIDDFYGWNFDGDNNNTIDIDGHGTHVSGTIAGTKNDFGVTGIAYDAQIMPVKVLDDLGSGSNIAVADGIYYAVDNGADIINLSLGGSTPSWSIESAIEYASNQGVTVVMAAGNNGDDEPIYPARYADEYGIAVGAINEDKNMASFSNRAGSEPLTYVTAPGVDIYSTLPNNEYASYSGTSMATPHVAGVVALMLSANSSFNNRLIQQTLRDTSSNTTVDDEPTQPNPFDLFGSFGSFMDLFDSFGSFMDLLPIGLFGASSEGGYISQSFSPDLKNTTSFSLSPDKDNFTNFFSSYNDYRQKALLNRDIEADEFLFD